MKFNGILAIILFYDLPKTVGELHDIDLKLANKQNKNISWNMDALVTFTGYDLRVSLT